MGPSKLKSVAPGIPKSVVFVYILPATINPIAFKTEVTALVGLQPAIVSLRGAFLI